MIGIDSTVLTVLLSVFFGIVAVTAMLTATVVGQFLVTNRKIRRSRHESIPAYYSALALHH